MGDNVHRLTQSFAQLWLTGVESVVLSSGSEELYRRTLHRAAQAIQANELAAVWLMRRFTEHAIVEDIVDNVEDAMEDAGLGRHRAATLPAIAFLDLTGFTRLTESHGDHEAAELAAKLAEIVHATSRAHRGRPVKFLGNGVMFHFTSSDGAVLAALELVGRIPQAGLPPARVGINTGPIVFRDGDYYGRTVNVAARIADYSRPREVLVSDEVRRSAGIERVAFTEVGTVDLKGVREPVTLHLVSRA